MVARGGNGFNFGGARALELKAAIKRQNAANERLWWTRARVDRLADLMADGHNFASAGVIMGRATGDVEKAFERLRVALGCQAI